VTSATAALLSCRDLELRIGARLLCRGLAFEACAGQCWAIVGPNGAGKTTLLRTLAGLRAPDAGVIAYEGCDVGGLSRLQQARRRAYLAENSTDFFPATALDAALLGRHPHLSRWRWESDADVELAHQALARLGLAACAERDVTTLSGGERRRVALAAMLAQDARLLLLDEPSSHLDLGQQIAAFDVLVDHARAGARTLVMVVHDLHLALRYADHAIAMGNGHAQAGTAADLLTADTLGPLFGRPLVAVGADVTRTLLPR
jgi:iron complex transport system ATP-binding protein